MLQGLKLNKDRVRIRGLSGGSAVVVCLLWAIGTAEAQQTGYFAPVGQVGNSTTISNFGRVGGRTTSTSTPLQAGRGAPPPGSVGNYLGRPNFSVTSAIGDSQNRPGASSSSLNQNAALANQMFGAGASTSVLGRVTPRSTGSATDFLVPTFSSKAAAARASNFYRGQTPAAVMLDRNSLLAPRSALARMASGPRSSMSLQQAMSGDSLAVQKGIDGESPSEPESEGVPALAVPAGLTPNQKREYRTQLEFQGCLERGDDYMRSKDFHKAKASYERARTISPDSAVPYCRLFVASLLMADFAQSGMYLRLATRRAKVAADMRIDPSECTPGLDDLRAIARAIAQANMRADTSEAEFVTLAYLSWLLDDPAIMRSELDRASRIATGTPEAVKLRELLLSASAPAQPQS